MKKILNRKWFIIPSLFLIFGAVAVIATTIGDSGYSGIQLDNYFSGSGRQGITQNISFNDSDGNNHLIEFEDGLIVGYSFIEPPESQFPSEGLVAYYKFDEPLGVVLDELHTYNGTNNGSTRGITGKIGNAFEFDGTDDYLYDFGLTMNWSEGTISSWANLSNSNGYRSIIGGDDAGRNDGDFLLGNNANTNNILWLSDDGATEIGLITDETHFGSGNWVFVSFTWNSTGQFIFVNGTMVKSNAVSNAPSQSDWYIGATNNFGQYWDGKLDEMGIWNRTLSQEEIQTLYNEGEGLTY